MKQEKSCYICKYRAENRSFCICSERGAIEHESVFSEINAYQEEHEKNAICEFFIEQP